MKGLAYVLSTVLFHLGIWLLGNLEVDMDNPLDYRIQLGWFGRLREDLAGTSLSWSNSLYYKYVMTDEERRDIDERAHDLVSTVMVKVLENQGHP